MAVGRQKNEEVSGTFSQLENVWSKYNIFGKRKMNHKRIAVIGGGAAGLMAAIAAAESGGQVTPLSPTSGWAKN